LFRYFVLGFATESNIKYNIGSKVLFRGRNEKIPVTRRISSKNAGTLNVRINGYGQESRTGIRPKSNNEINGLTFGGEGIGTTVDFIEFITSIK